jgi:hypothetical protein
LEEYDEINRGFLGKLGWWSGLSATGVTVGTVVAVVALNKYRK